MNIIDDMIYFYNATHEGDIDHDSIIKILDNLDKVKHATIYDMAEICFVSPSTISRLCRKLNCKSYGEFRTEIVKVLENYDYYSRIVPARMINSENDEIDILLNMIEHSVNHLRTLDKQIYEDIADALHAHKRIHIYSYGASTSMLFVQNTLSVAGHQVRATYRNSISFEPINNFNSDDAVIFAFPVFKETEKFIQALKSSYEKKCYILFVTSNADEKLLNMAGHHYNFTGALTVMDNYSRELFLNMVVMVYRRKFID